ncbi:MAG: hypothetical protein AB1489_36920, partial [Acidobacteriota bacterium]
MGGCDSRRFSLVEAVVVLTLLLIVVVISIPLITGSTVFSKLPNDGFDLAGGRVHAKFHTATEQIAFRINFDLPNKVYVLDRHLGIAGTGDFNNQCPFTLSTIVT